MQALSDLVKVTFANYIRDLPLPNTFLGMFSLSVGDWLRLLPFAGAVGGVAYLAYKNFKQQGASQCCNTCIDKGNPKVVTSVDIEDITGDKVCYCRCWKSKKFPFCDGSHTAHNKTTGDNVGPLVIKRKAN